MYNYVCCVQVICWRAAASIAWAVLLLPPITAVFVILSRFSLFHPIHTISGQSPWNWTQSCVKLCAWRLHLSLLAECFSLLMSASAIFSFILLAGVILMVGFLNLEYYTGERQYNYSYTATICSSDAELRAVSLKRLCAHLIISYCLVFLFSHPSYSMLQNRPVGSAAPPSSVCQLPRLLQHGINCCLVLCHLHGGQLWDAQLPMHAEWWVGCRYSIKVSCWAFHAWAIV